MQYNPHPQLVLMEQSILALGMVICIPYMVL